jgi:hypothetical protein
MEKLAPSGDGGPTHGGESMGEGSQSGTSNTWKDAWTHYHRIEGGGTGTKNIAVYYALAFIQKA